MLSAGRPWSPILQKILRQYLASTAASYRWKKTSFAFSQQTNKQNIQVCQNKKQCIDSSKSSDVKIVKAPQHSHMIPCDSHIAL